MAQRPQRVVKQAHAPIMGVDEQKNITKIVINEETRILKMKNALPSGLFNFRAEDGSTPQIEAGREFEITESELVDILDTEGIRSGHAHFMEIYEGYDTICNAMSDDKIREICKFTKKKFEDAILKLDSEITFKRIKDILIEKKRPSGYLQFVDFHEKGLREKFLAEQRYETAAQKNERVLKNLMGG